MARMLGEHWEGAVRVRWHEDASGDITVQRSQDSQSALDLVAAVNAEGAPTIDGLGKPVAEIPVVEAMAWAEQRGIPWEKLLYSNEYDAEFRRFIQDHSRLAYENRKSVMAVQ